MNTILNRGHLSKEVDVIRYGIPEILSRKFIFNKLNLPTLFRNTPLIGGIEFCGRKVFNNKMLNFKDINNALNLKIISQPSFALLFLLPATLLLSSCGQGGAGIGYSGGGNPATPPADTIVSGSVQAPNGQIAFLGSKNIFERLTEIIMPSANALISGLSCASYQLMDPNLGIIG